MRHYFLVGVLATSFLAHAQQPTSAGSAPLPARLATMPKQPKVAMPYKAGAPEQRAEKMSKQLGQEFGLDATTVAKVKAAALMRDQQIDAIQMGSDSNKAKNSALQANAQEFKAALKAILTPEQFARFRAMSRKRAAS